MGTRVLLRVRAEHPHVAAKVARSAWLVGLGLANISSAINT